MLSKLNNIYLHVKNWLEIRQKGDHNIMNQWEDRHNNRCHTSRFHQSASYANAVKRNRIKYVLRVGLKINFQK